ncbi:hypothetical protein [Synechococcus sp. ROS8604]|uniref:hypothetical protein n=1 Tax=Synechococcus sp. ROS8604 TaxID=1442557 RepID=UPI0016449CFD|nr:hypothetical protein [Synechococcus sp. ROS8604]
MRNTPAPCAGWTDRFQEIVDTASSGEAHLARCQRYDGIGCKPERQAMRQREGQLAVLIQWCAQFTPQFG